MGDTNPFLNVLKQENLSHAYLCVGDFEQNKNDFEFALNEIGLRINTPGNFVFIGDTFKKSDADDLNTWYNNNATSDAQYTIAVLAPGTLKIEAQQLLLKVFEEAKYPYILFLFVPNGIDILPTIKSRCSLIELENSIDAKIEIEKFIKMPAGERIKNVAEQIKNKESHEVRTYTEELVRDLIVEFHGQKFENDKDLSRHQTDILEKLLKAQNSLADSHIAPKFILDYVITVIK